MRKTLYSIVLAGVWLTACTEAGPVVQDAATYSVSLTSDIVYGEGLGYDPRGDDERVALPLKLDVYTPENTAERRPVFVWIHGGGFTGGSKTADDIEAVADFYATRGWVFVSLNYRTTEVMGDGYDLCKGDAAPDYEEAVAYYQGITPPEWTRYSCAQTENRLNFHQSIAMYAAQRDAKAALRWVVSNASAYNIDVNHITVGGNSAGAITAATLGITDEDDFRDEIPAEDDPTLATTHLSESYTVQSIVWYWGARHKLTLFEGVYGIDPYDSADPALFMAHGLAEKPEESPTPYTEAEAMQTIYDGLGLHNELYLLDCDIETDPECPFEDGWGHSAWDATVDGRSLTELAFAFIVDHQGLAVE